MMRTGAVILVFFIFLDGKEIFPGEDIHPCMAGYFNVYLRFCEDITKKIELYSKFLASATNLKCLGEKNEGRSS